MLHAAAVGLLIALAPTQADPVAASPKTLWLVEPLYPGQEFVVARTEDALNRLMPKESRPADLVGTRELAAHLQGRAPDLRCLTGDVACTDPVDYFVRALGLERVVMVRGGQEEGSYRYKVTSYVPGTGETTSAEGANPALDRALMGALVKVVPLASIIEVSSTPAGATVFIDNEKVGTTPYTGQILPGERTVKLEAPSHMPGQKTINVPVRGKVAVQETLEKVPARIVISAEPKGTVITVDGNRLGVDKVDKPIQPGTHTVELSQEGYVTHTEQVEIKPGDTWTVEKTLAPTTWTSIRLAMKEAEKDIQERKVFIEGGYQHEFLHGFSGGSLTPGRAFSNAEYQMTRLSGAQSPLVGGFLGYGHEGKNFGLLAVGAGYFRSLTPWTYEVQDDRNPGDRLVDRGFVDGAVLRALQPHLRVAIWKTTLSLRAGPELRALRFQINEPDIARHASEGLFAVQLNVSAQALMRIYVIEGLFLEGGYHYSLAILGNANPNGFQGALGYAF
ncbi:MAG: PEGA domain-containing protein [Myxococcales bacterium]